MVRLGTLGIVGLALPLLVSVGSARDMPLVGPPVVVQRDEILVYPQADWSRTVTPPPTAPGQHLVLMLDQRLATTNSGGCNWVLQVRLNGDPLTERLLRPRLLNKPSTSDLKGVTSLFRLYDAGRQAWNTLFSSDYEHVLMFDADDYRMVWDISDYVTPGAKLELSFHYARPEIPGILKQPAPLALRRIELGVMAEAEVEKLQAEALAAGQSWRTVPVEAALPPGSTPGPRAYEVAWVDRKEAPTPQVTFEHLEGWTAQVLGEADVRVSASQEQLIWRPQVLKVTANKAGRGTRLILRPPAPVSIAGPWDAVNLWLHADQYGTRGGPLIGVTAAFDDADGKELEVGLGSINAGYWMIQHGILPAAQRAHVRFPVRLVALVFDQLGAAAPATLYVESLACYAQQRHPYAVSPRPVRPSFPTTADGTLPTPPAGAHSSVTGSGAQAIFTCRMPGGTLRYEIRPQTGAFGDVSATFQGHDGPVSFRPLDGGSVMFATRSGTVSAAAGCTRLVSTRLRSDRLETIWRFTSGEVTAEYLLSYRLRGATLVIDATARGGQAEGVRFGRITGLPQPQAIDVPYLVMGNKPGPYVACSAGLFVSCLTDWVNSDYSYSDTTMPSSDAPGLAVNGGTSYGVLTDGRRNDLRDRLLVTVAPDFADVLPNIPHPVSANHQQAADCTYFMYGGPTPNFWRVLSRYGMERVIAMDFGHFWDTISGDGFASRWRPRPGVTEADLAAYRKGVESLGFLFGLLLEYTDYFPVNEFWDENKISLESDGNWKAGWYGHYRAKPNAYRFLANQVGTRIRARYPTDAVYMDVHSNLGLIAQDYEAGVPGAGMARASVLYNGEGMLETRRLGGVVCSEGIDRCLYAGLTDMDYGTWYTRGNASELPILPDYDLLKIHPLAHGTGMGYNPSAFFPQDKANALFGDAGKPEAPPEFYQYLAATIAHGHMAILGYSYFPPPARMLQYYCLLHGLQQEYLTDRVVEISRHDGTRFVSTSEMLQHGGLGQGRLRVRYARGLQVCVNYHRTQTWEVEVNGRKWVLPPDGWIAEQPGRLLAFSALIEGRRLDYVNCPQYVYFSSGGVRQSYAGITVQGAVFVKRGKDGLQVIPCGDLGSWRLVPTEGFPFYQDRGWPEPPAGRGCDEIVLDLASLLAGCDPAHATVSGRERDARPVPVVSQRNGSVLHLTPGADWLDCLVKP